MGEVPATIFTDPEVASVGLTEKAARALYGKDSVSILFRRLSQVDRAICENTHHHGFLKIIYHTKTQQVLGGTIMAPVAGELISELAVAQKCNMKLNQLATVMHAYPSYSIALQQMAVEVYYANLKKKRALFGFLKWIGL